MIMAALVIFLIIVMCFLIGSFIKTSPGDNSFAFQAYSCCSAPWRAVAVVLP